MSLGSRAGTASLTLALKVRAHLVTPVSFSSRREPSAHDVEEEMDTTEGDAKEEKMKIEDGQDPFTWPAHLAWCTAGLTRKTKRICRFKC